MIAERPVRGSSDRPAPAARDAAGLVAAVLAVALVAAGCGSAPLAEPVPPRVAAVQTPTPTATPTPTRAPPPRAVVVWAMDHPHRAARRLRGHPDVEVAAVAGRGVALLRSSAGEGGRLVQRVRAGYAIPLDVLSVDPPAYARTLTGPAREAFAGLRPGRALISRTSARLRRIGEGGWLRLVGGRRLRVAGVLPDEDVRGAEVAVSSRDPRVRAGDRASVVVLLEPGAPVRLRELARRAERGAAARLVGDDRIRLTGATGPARPAELKARFGEPAVGLPYGDDWVRLDPRFVSRYLVSRRVPILGTVTCHRAMVPALRRALGELRRRGLSRLVNPGDYAGCYAPRRIRPDGALSLHAWGLAVDLNARANPFGGRSRQDPRLVRTMIRHGFTWGGDWPTTRDPMHFEYRGR